MIPSRGSPRKRVRISPRNSNSLSPSSRDSVTQNSSRNGVTNRVSVKQTQLSKKSKKKKKKSKKMAKQNGSNQTSKHIVKDSRNEDENVMITDDDIVFWTRAGSRTFWPARRCTPEERAILESAREDNVGRKQANRVCVFYFGSEDVGYVSKANMLPFEKYFSRFHKKNNSRPFNIAIEVAKGEILKLKNEKSPAYKCPICLGSTSEITSSDTVLICDRCHDEVHMACLHPPVANVPEGEWFCPRCEEDAPLSIAAIRQSEEEERLKSKMEKERIEQKTKQRKIEEYLNKEKSVSDKVKEVEIEIEKNKEKEKQKENEKENETHKNRELHKEKKKRSRKERDPEGCDSNSKKLKPFPSCVKQIPETTIGVNGHHSAENATASVTSSNINDDLMYDVKCYVCNMGGNGHDQGMIACDFKECTRVYHVNCIGDAYPHLAEDEEIDKEDRSIQSFKNDKEWFCPWHYCAVCKEVEPDSGSKLKYKPWPLKSQLKAGVVTTEYLDDESHLEKTTRISKRKDNEKSRIPSFSRCISCPLALCSKHATAPCELITKEGEVFVPAAIARSEKKGFFNCVHCSGWINASRGKQVFTSPSKVTFARVLSTIWSRLVNRHFRLLAPFLQKPQIIDISKPAMVGGQYLLDSSQSPISLTCIREKIWNLKYTSLAEFEENVDHVRLSVAALIGKNQLVIQEAAETIPFLLLDAIRPYRKQLKDLEKKIRTEKKAEEYGPLGLLNTDNSLPNTLLPSVQALISRVTADVGKKTKPKISPEEWAMRIVNGPDLDNHIEQRTKFIEATSKGSITTLVEAICAIDNDGVEEGTVARPSIESGHDAQLILERHAANLRTALVDISKLKSAFAPNHHQQSNIDNEVLTIGEMRVAAEYRLANRNLKKRMADLSNLLAIERGHRKELQKEIVLLQEKIDSLEKKT